jgi:hypothetical protein
MMQAASPGSRRAVLRRSEKTRFIVCERRRSRRVHSAIRAERSEPLEHGNRAPPHGGEASGGVPLRATTTAADSRCSRRRSAGGDGGTTLFRSVSSDEDGGNRADIAASEASNQIQRDARAASKNALLTPRRSREETLGAPHRTPLGRSIERGLPAHPARHDG